MKKFAQLVVAIAFAFSVVLAVINTSANTKYESSNNAYSSICPKAPPPPPPPKGDN